MGEETLGQRLVSIREKRGLSQVEVAKLTGLKVQNISRLETETRKHVRSDTLFRLALVLECSADELIGIMNAQGQRAHYCKRAGCGKVFYGNTVANYCYACWQNMTPDQQKEARRLPNWTQPLRQAPKRPRSRKAMVG